MRVDSILAKTGSLVTLGASLTVTGDFTVLGNTFTADVTDLNVTDRNITINNGGNDALSEGAGLTVARTGTAGSLVYANALASKWACGALGSESEIITSAGAQTITGVKTFTSNLEVTGAVTLGPATGDTHTINGSVILAAANNATSSIIFQEATVEELRIDFVGTSGDAQRIDFVSDSVVCGSMSDPGAWTLGPSGATTLGHTVNGLTTFNTASTNTGAYVVNVTKGATSTAVGANYFVSFGISGTNANSGRIATNGVNAAAFFSTSDRRLKTDIEPLNDGLAKIMALNPVNYKWKEGGASEVGFIAQEVLEVIPHVVGKKEDDGTGESLGDNQEAWTLTDGGPKGFLPYLVKSIQELNTKVESLSQALQSKTAKAKK
jgi:hypothetical protein